ncbi:MAG: LysM peptidoglycan-binding domain-containing protein [Paludibacteraceae bacterium]|nr:LysM peptidoglycan-binding domain-containing protein [Paludibacteraceae bacterium]
MHNLIKNTICISLLLLGGINTAWAVKTVNGKKYFSYMVQTGETVEGLANAFKVTVAELEERNPTLKDGIKGGMIISVPVKEGMLNDNLPEISIITYKVKPGDTLFSLAKNNNSTIDDIIQRNSEALSDGILWAGSTIKIAKNSGGLSGSEDKIQERKKQEKLQAELRKKAIQDSINNSKKNYWLEPWTIINVKTPGSIDTLKSEMEWRTITRLKVTGTANLLDAAVVGKRIFEFDRIKALDLHEATGITKLSSKVFQECNSLKAISLPNTIDSVGVNTFIGSGENLEALRIYSTKPPKCTEKSFNGINFDKCSLEVPQSALTAYKSSAIWNLFKKITAIPTAGNEK